MQSNALVNLVCLLQSGILYKKGFILVRYSFLCLSVLRLFVSCGYINFFNIVYVGGLKYFGIGLRFFDGLFVLRRIRLISKPFNRIFWSRWACRVVFERLQSNCFVVVLTQKGVFGLESVVRMGLGGEPLLFCSLSV